MEFPIWKFEKNSKKNQEKKSAVCRYSVDFSAPAEKNLSKHRNNKHVVLLHMCEI